MIEVVNVTRAGGHSLNLRTSVLYSHQHTYVHCLNLVFSALTQSVG